jgi:hypothetical protein
MNLKFSSSQKKVTIMNKTSEDFMAVETGIMVLWVVTPWHDNKESHNPNYNTIPM